MAEQAAVVENLEGDAIQVNLPGQLTIAGSSSLHEELARIVESTDVVTLNASHVEKVDTAGIQLIAAFAHERSDQSLITELRHRPDRLTEALAMLGLTAVFS
ncbi:MAG: STAS domain-containing protein [Pseudomonadota bacterium]